MFDLRLRSTKDRLLAPIGEQCPRFLSASSISVASFVCCAGAGAAAWRGAIPLSIALWLVGRVLDGLDGAVARARGTASDFGGYLDFVLDTAGYSFVPLGIAFGVDETGTWQIVAILIGTFYVNAVSWLLLSAVLEKGALGAASTGEQTSVTMPTGLIEGTETIVFFTIALAFPQHADVIFLVMAAGVVISTVQRVFMASKVIGPRRERT